MAEIQKKTLAVKGMTCASCAARIEKIVSAQEGIKGVAVNLACNEMGKHCDDLLGVLHG